MNSVDYQGWKDTIEFLQRQLEFREFHAFDWFRLVLA